MDIPSIIIIMFIAIVLIVTFYIIGIYNELIDASSKVEHQFKQINKEIKELEKIIPEVIELIKKDAKHEEKILNQLKEIKTNKDDNINNRIEYYDNLNKHINKVFELKKTYPKLKSNKDLASAEKKLKEINEKVDYASHFYNEVVEEYNNLKSNRIHKIVAKAFKLNDYNYLNKEEK